MNIAEAIVSRGRLFVTVALLLTLVGALSWLTMPRPEDPALPARASLKVGLFARVAIDAKRSCGVAIPRSAIDHSTIQVVTDNVVETRRVRVGLVSDTRIEILDGLKKDEIVVANAGTSLHDGDRVKIMFADDLDRSRAR